MMLRSRLSLLLLVVSLVSPALVGGAECDPNLLSRLKALLGAAECYRSTSLSCFALESPVLGGIGVLTGAGFYSIGSLTKTSMEIDFNQKTYEEAKHIINQEMIAKNYAYERLEIQNIKSPEERAAKFKEYVAEAEKRFTGTGVTLDDHRAYKAALDKLTDDATPKNYRAMMAARSKTGTFLWPELDRLAMRNLMLAQGLKTVGTALGGVAATTAMLSIVPSNTGTCSENYQQYSSYDSKCKPEYSMSPKVEDFLNLSRTEQKRLLDNDSKLCSYYSKFADELQKGLNRKIEIQNVECGVDGGIRVKVSYNGKPTFHQLKLSAKGDSISSIDVQPADANVVDHQEKVSLQFTPDEKGVGKLVSSTVRSAFGVERKVPVKEFGGLLDNNHSNSIENTLEAFQSAQGYSEQALNCCKQSGGAQSQCLNKMMSKPGGSGSKLSPTGTSFN